MKFLFFAFKSLSRNPVRATLTLLGVGVAMFLFTGVVSLDQGMRRMLANSAGVDTLSAISGVTGIVEFSRWLGYLALGIIVIGVGNSLAMTIRDRTREFAIYKDARLSAAAGAAPGDLRGGAGLALRRSAGRWIRVAGGEPVESLALRRGIHDSAARHTGACFMGGRLGRCPGNGSGSSSSN
jgi:hypothetical protein